MHRRLNYYLNDLGKDWPAAWGNYLRSLAKWRSIDQLRRQVELPGLLQLANDSSSDLAQTLQNFPDSDAPPDVIVQEAERRQRQARLLSEILKGFVIWCEEVPTRSQTKEVYERRLRGQSPNEIAEAMQITRNHVDVIVKRARDRIDGQIRQRDPRKSVFMTLLLGQPMAKRPAVSPGSRFSRFEDVLHFVISEMGALCPSEERLWQYVRDKTRPEFSDIRYHVQVCRICQVELSRWLA
jgi:DNA-directed RNA polymerase specialized sigma24 family protein